MLETSQSTKPKQPAPQEIPVSLRDCALGLLALLCPDPAQESSVDQELVYLNAYKQLFHKSTGDEIIETISTALSDPVDDDLNLAGYATTQSLTLYEVVVMALCLTIEQNPMIGRSLE